MSGKYLLLVGRKGRDLSKCLARVRECGHEADGVTSIAELQALFAIDRGAFESRELSGGSVPFQPCPFPDAVLVLDSGDEGAEDVVRKCMEISPELSVLRLTPQKAGVGVV